MTIANTTLQIKTSGVSGNVPSSLAFGELALNYTDGKLYYKNNSNTILSLSAGGGSTNSFATVNANSTLVLASSSTDVLTIIGANGTTVKANSTTKTITIGSNVGSIATQNSSSVSITGGNISGVIFTGTSYIVVPASNTASNNGLSLVSAYNTASTMMPYGSALSATNRVTVIVEPGQYTTGGFNVANNYVDIVSATGDSTVFLDSINVTANNVYIKGLNLGGNPFTVSSNVSGTFVNCVGGNYSFCGVSSSTAPIFVPGTFTNCTAGYASFGSSGYNSFSGGSTVVSGTFTNCTAGYASFGSSGYGSISGGSTVVSGTFTNCTAGFDSFGYGFSSANVSGTFTNCTAGFDSFGVSSVGGGSTVVSGTFTNCTTGSGGYNSFGTSSGNTNVSGTFISCIAGSQSFGASNSGNTNVSGTFFNCLENCEIFNQVNTINVSGNNDITITSAQSINPTLTLTGALTANIYVIVPNTVQSWIVNNSSTGAYTITVATASGTGVLVQQSAVTQVYGDGTNVIFVSSSASVGGGGGITTTTQNITANTTAGSAANTNYIYFASNTSYITLPTAVNNTNLYVVKNVDGSVITINTTSSQTIDGSLTISIKNTYTSLSMMSNGSQWFII